MTLNIPSTSLRSQYLKKLKVGTVYADPTTGYFYQVIEKQLNNSLIKVAVPSFDGSKAIQLDDVPEQFLKVQNTTNKQRSWADGLILLLKRIWPSSSPFAPWSP